eukprot:gene8903-biopygen7011
MVDIGSYTSGVCPDLNLIGSLDNSVHTLRFRSVCPFTAAKTSSIVVAFRGHGGQHNLESELEQRGEG